MKPIRFKYKRLSESEEQYQIIDKADDRIIATAKTFEDTLIIVRALNRIAEKQSKMGTKCLCEKCVWG